MSFVVITNTADVHADMLAEAADRESVKFVRINTDHVRHDSGVIWKHDKPASWIYDARRVDFEDVKVVYSRRPKAVVLDTDPWASRFINKEWDHIEAAICDAAPICFNPPIAERAKNRLIQLQVAKQAGLPVPYTQVSSLVGILQGCVAARPSITKGINNSYIRHEGKMYSAFTRKVTLKDFEDYPEGIPTLVQQYIKPVAHWRVVTLLEQFHAVRHTGDAIEADVDSRRIELELEGEPAELPDHIKRGLRRMRANLCYNFASSDFVEDEDGQLWFLDLNPSGQWAFLEERFGIPLSKAFITLARSPLSY